MSSKLRVASPDRPTQSLPHFFVPNFSKSVPYLLLSTMAGTAIGRMRSLSTIIVGIRYAIYGTDMDWTPLPINPVVLRKLHAMSGTEMGCAATRSGRTVDTRRTRASSWVASILPCCSTTRRCPVLTGSMRLLGSGIQYEEEGWRTEAITVMRKYDIW